MTRTSILAGITVTVILGFAGAANAYDNCRNYKQNRSINGYFETGYATACYNGRGVWEITEISAPVELRSPLIETVKRDVFKLGGARVTLTTTNVRPAYVYQPRRGGFVTPHNGYTYRHVDWKDDKHHNHKKYSKHDKRDKHDHHDRHDYYSHHKH